MQLNPRLVEEILDAPDARRGLSIIGSTLVMKGEIFAGEDLLIEGRIDGRVVGTDTVTIRRDAKLKGEISATTIQVEYGVRLDEVKLSGKIAQLVKAERA